MQKYGYQLTNKMLVLNFTQVYCKSSTEVLNSDCFKDVFTGFVKHCRKHEKLDILKILDLTANPIEDFVNLFKLIHTFEYEEIENINPKYARVLKERGALYNLVEEFYDYWRKLERYSYIVAKKVEGGVQGGVFLATNQTFTEVILKTYRSISESIAGHKFQVYRQLPAGINASMLISYYSWAKEDSIYNQFNEVPSIESVLIRPPFISYTKKNKRTGTYPISKTNPLTNVKIDPNDYLCYPIKVGSALAFVYFHKHFMTHGITLSNLFEPANLSDLENKKPELLYLFGYGSEESSYYYDSENDIYIGIAPLSDDVDYFGYMKKMLLTLYNTKMIKEGNLPIHGACVHIKLKSNTTKTLVIIGDSGAGKSETLEALRAVAGDEIVSMSTIFDDMGTFKIEKGNVMAYGTEIGAFVRLDDMSSDYAYKEMDRAIFLNPDKINSRLVIPVSTYYEIMHGYKVDMVLYANNYVDKEELKLFENKDEALNVFIEGARMAKGTTGEIGLTKSFFANPFGPVQMEEETRVILDKIYSKLFENKIPVGEMYTRLAIPGYEQDGPHKMAEILLKEIEEN